ncbi:MAG: hypothetical protein GX061_05815 [Eubacteriaceae bacterium]|nr:hypothetical protein [Eubacteriaceae bacterium]
MDKIKQAYAKRVNRINRVLSHVLPDRVPVVPAMREWFCHNAGLQTDYAMTRDWKSLYRSIEKTGQHIYFDAAVSLNMPGVCAEYEALKRGLSLEGSENALNESGPAGDRRESFTMGDEDYPLLAASPSAYLANEVFPAKYKEFLKGNKADAKRIYRAMKASYKKEKILYKTQNALKSNLGIPVIASGSLSLPADFLEGLRGRRNLFEDMTLRPDEFSAACEALCTLLLEDALSPFEENPADENRIIMIEMPFSSLLRPMDFARHALPYLKRTIESLYSAGCGVLLMLEGDWHNKRDILAELPGEKLIGFFEQADLSEYKRTPGIDMTLMGGMPGEVLARGSAADCLKCAEKCLDEYAPGGNYIFSTDGFLDSPQSAQAENLTAVCEFVKVNGKY